MLRKKLGLSALFLLASGLAIAVACGGKETVVETVIVEKPVTRVEKVVETVIVEKQVPGETRVQKVIETVVVEKPVTRVEKVVQTVVVEKEVAGKTVKVVETVLVEKPVTRVQKVIETVVVPKEVVVEKKVVETVVVEKEVEKIVEVTPTPVPSFFGLPIPKPAAVTGQVPVPKTAMNKVVLRSTGGFSAQLGVSGMPTGEGTGGGALGLSVTEKFFRTDESGKVVPQILESWELAPDLTSLTVKLKEGIPWHKHQGGDFGELTSADVVWSLNTGNPATNPESITDGGGAWVSFIGPNPVVAVDKYTVKIPIDQFDVRWETFIFGQSGLGLSIFSKNAFDQMGKDWTLTHLVGTGPFEIEEVSPAAFIRLMRVDNHYRITPEVEKLEVRLVIDDAVAMAMMRTGDLDVSTVPLRDMSTFRADGWQLVSAGAGSFHTITFAGNYWEDKFFKSGEEITAFPTYVHSFPWVGDPRRPKFGIDSRKQGDVASLPADMTSMERARLVRKALAMAFDRDKINEVLFAGAGWPNYIYGHDINNPNYDPKWVFPYDPAQSERLLDQAGYPRGDNGIRFQLPFFIRLGAGDEEIGTAVAGYWREIGLDVVETRAAYAVFRPGLIARSASQVWIHSAGAESPQVPWDWPAVGVYTSTLGRPTGYNIGQEDRFLAEKYTEMNAEPDTAKRNEIRSEIAEHIFHWLVSIGTVAEPNVALSNPKKIASWPMPISVREAAWHHPEFIKLAK